jgi:SAM-dependent methyltransferase
LNEYSYPDIADQCTTRLVADYSKTKWALEERWILNKVFNILKASSSGKSQHMIDVGCGEGRLLHVFSPLFGWLLCIDPDTRRLAIAKDVAKTQKILGVSFKAGTIPDLSLPDVVDFILCSHILQHIPTYNFQSFIQWISDHLKPGGMTLILFAKSTAKNDFFSVQQQDGTIQVVSEKRFNEIFNQPNTLPVHHIPPISVEDALLKVGLHITNEFSYHIGKSVPKSFIITVIRFLSSLKYLSRRIGIDHAILACKE